jgi:hypothetical protein
VTVEDVGQPDAVDVTARQNARHRMADGAESGPIRAISFVLVSLTVTRRYSLCACKRGATPREGTTITSHTPCP